MPFPKTTRRGLLGLAVAASLATAPSAPRAESVKELKIAVQFGLAFLPLLVAEDQRLIEARLKEAGLPEVKVDLVRFSGAPAVNDAVLSGNVSLAAYGTTGFLIAWERTRNNAKLKGICGISVVPNILLTNRADIRSIKDFKPEDRVTTPATTSPQALTIRLALERAYGRGEHGRLDAQMVTQSNPDGTRALVNGLVQGLVTTPPFVSDALASGKVQAIGSLEEELGGPSTFIILAAREKFATENPKTSAAVLAAMRDAAAFIAKDPEAAARIYVKSEGSKMDPAMVAKIIQEPGNLFTTEPLRVLPMAEAMARHGHLKAAPSSWKELFLPPITDGAGS